MSEEEVTDYMTSAQALAAMAATPMDTLRRKLAMGDVHIAHARETFCAPDEDDETTISDMLADLMHVCEREGISFEDLYETALDNYNAERTEIPK